MTDQFGPGSHVLYQDFVVPADVTSASLSFDYFINNLNGTFVTPNTLDFTPAVANQQTRVDVITTSANPFASCPPMCCSHCWLRTRTPPRTRRLPRV